MTLGSTLLTGGREGRTVPVELVEWSIGPVRLVSVPGEAFHALGRAIEERARADGAHVLLAGLAPEWHGYLPSPFRDGYEESTSYGRDAVARSRLADERAARRSRIEVDRPPREGGSKPCRRMPSSIRSITVCMTFTARTACSRPRRGPTDRASWSVRSNISSTAASYSGRLSRLCQSSGVSFQLFSGSSRRLSNLAAARPPRCAART